MEGFEVCRKARATCLAGGERSILKANEEEGREGKKRGRRRAGPMAQGRLRRDQQHCSSVAESVGSRRRCRYGVESHQLRPRFSFLPKADGRRQRCGEASSGLGDQHVQPINSFCDWCSESLRY